MKTNKSNIRIQNSIRIAQRTLENLKAIGAKAGYVELAEKNLTSAKALLK